MNEEQWIETLTKEGFQEVVAHTFTPRTDFGEHTHDVSTVHVILEGELILKEQDGEKSILQGERIDISAGTTHGARTGPDGCTFVVGFKGETVLK